MKLKIGLLETLLLIPTVIQTTCLVVASADEGFQSSNSSLRIPDDIPEDFNQRQAADEQIATLDRRLSSDDLQLVNRGIVAPRMKRKCIPMFNLSPHLNNGTSDSSTNLQRRVSFNIDDIDVPIAPPSGTFSSAIKLMSSLEGQLDPESEEPEAVENVIKFRENSLQIKGLNLTMLNVHLYNEGEPKFGIGITIKNTTLTGQFAYNGAMTLASVKLSGYYRMSIDNIYLVVTSNLTKSKNEHETDRSKQFSLRTHDFRMNISNIGYISIDIFDHRDAIQPTEKYLLKMLQRLLQRTIKRTYYLFENYIRNALEAEGRDILDCELTRFAPLLSSDSSNHQSDLSSIISSELVRTKLDLVQLPDFVHQQTFLGNIATVQFNNGSLSGLEHLKLIGETRIKLQDDHLFANTSIGWYGLKPYYTWTLVMGSRTAKGFVSFNIKAIDFDALITKGLSASNVISVDQLNIKRLDTPRMDIGGLPGMNRVTRTMINFFMGRMKERLAGSIQPVLKQQLQRLLNTCERCGTFALQ